MTIGYKKCFDPATENFVLVELEIPEDAKIVDKDDNNFYGWPCFEKKKRTSKAIVKKIHGGCKKAVAMYDNLCVYEEGKEVTGLPEISWDDENVCGNGIHYFDEKELAIKYATGGYVLSGGDKYSAGFDTDVNKKAKKVTYYLILDAICDDPVEQTNEKQPYYVVYVTQGQGEAEAGTYFTESDAINAVQAGVDKGDGSYRYLKVTPV
jgi:hypothetical protein